MTIVYLDSVFLTNLLVDYFLLLAASALAGEPPRRLRLAAGALVGAAYAVLVFLPGCRFLAALPCKLAFALLMALAAFGGTGRLLRMAILFLALGCGFGGLLLALSFFEASGSGSLYGWLDLKRILLAAACCYGLFALCFRGSARHGLARRELLPCTVRYSGRSVSLTALRDSGNTLTDPLTGKPVLVAEGARLGRLFLPGEAPDASDLRDPASVMERLAKSDRARDFCLLSYRSVGVESGLLLALRAEGVTVGERNLGGILVALSPSPVGTDCQALIGL